MAESPRLRPAKSTSSEPLATSAYGTDRAGSRWRSAIPNSAVTHFGTEIDVGHDENCRRSLSTRNISANITRPGRSKPDVPTTASAQASRRKLSANGSSAALPSRKATLSSPAAEQRSLALVSICGVRSNATTSRADFAMAALRVPGPQATSSTDPCPASPSATTKRSVNALSVIAAEAEKVSACRVNSSRTRWA